MCRAILHIVKGGGPAGVAYLWSERGPTKLVKDGTLAKFSVIANLLKEVEIPRDGTLSGTIHRDDHMKVVLFGFAGGQELSQHTAAVPAVIEILQGGWGTCF